MFLILSLLVKTEYIAFLNLCLCVGAINPTPTLYIADFRLVSSHSFPLLCFPQMLVFENSDCVVYIILS